VKIVRRVSIATVLALGLFGLAACSSAPTRPRAARAPRPAATPVAATPAPAPEPTPLPPPPTAIPESTNPSVAKGAEFDQVRVFFATDRKETDGLGFGGERGAEITYGSVFVSIPRGHQVGAIERPSLWAFQFSEDAAKHMVILRRSSTDRDGFMEDIRAMLQRGGSDASFVFVHGYNVAFDDAARRTAQITYDLDFRGAPVFYSWPSQASLEGYTVDESNVEWSQLNLKNFLLDYAQNSGAKDIYLIAHSMGNRALTRAVAALFTEHPELKGRFKEIILTAPDVDADVFKREIAPKLVAGCDKITLYVSDGDKALLASKKVHGYPRLGDSAAGISVVPGIETVDASGLDTSFLEHSYFAETSSVLKDIRQLVLQGLRAAQRGLTEKRAGAEAGERYWKFELTATP
jgi:esterase/lipase superfamily enzyme